MRSFSLVGGQIRMGPRLVGLCILPTMATIARRVSRILAFGTRRLAASGRARRSHKELRNGPAWRLRDIGYEPIWIEFPAMCASTQRSRPQDRDSTSLRAKLQTNASNSAWSVRSWSR